MHRMSLDPRLEPMGNISEQKIRHRSRSIDAFLFDADGTTDGICTVPDTREEVRVRHATSWGNFSTHKDPTADSLFF